MHIVSKFQFDRAVSREENETQTSVIVTTQCLCLQRRHKKNRKISPCL